jgi:hypothetical protein
MEGISEGHLSCSRKVSERPPSREAVTWRKVMAEGREKGILVFLAAVANCHRLGSLQKGNFFSHSSSS